MTAPESPRWFLAYLPAERAWAVARGEHLLVARYTRHEARTVLAYLNEREARERGEPAAPARVIERERDGADVH